MSIILDNITRMGQQFLANLPKIIIALVILLITRGISRLIDSFPNTLFRRLKLRDSLSELFRKLSYMFIWIIGIMTACVVVFPDFAPSREAARLTV